MIAESIRGYPTSILVAVTLCFASDAQARMSVSVGSPGIFSTNVLAGVNADFEKDLSGWRNRYSNEVYCVTSAGHGLVLSCPSSGKTVARYIPMRLLKKGSAYILSCDIRPSREVSSAQVAGGGSGLGCSLSFWDKTWRNVISIGCCSEGPDMWQRVSSRPIIVPEWAAWAEISAGVMYSKGNGFVDNIELVEVGGGIDVSVKSDGAPIRQVKAVDERGKIVFDSGLIDGGQSWSRHIEMDSALRFKVYAVDALGDVAVGERVDRN